MFPAIKTTEKFLLDLIFPQNCLICKKSDFLICPDCFKEIEILPYQVCPICERAITIGGKICSQCKSTKPALNQLIVAGDYQDPGLAKMIHFYKYKFVSDFSIYLGKILLKGLIKNNIETPDVIVPIPLHSFRLRWRGYNQSELLANFLASNLLPGIKLPVTNNLILRNKNTTPQMKIKNYQKRQENMKNVFKLNPHYGQEANTIKNKKVLLVDDICTTGATILECAKEIKKLKPQSISAVVLARQS
jgi:ComF family protein